MPTLNSPSWWLFAHPFEKYVQVKLNHVPNLWGEKKIIYLKQPPSHDKPQKIN